MEFDTEYKFDEDTIDMFLLMNNMDAVGKELKEKRKMLKEVLFNEGVNLDHNELRKSKNYITSEEYVKLVNQSRNNISTAFAYIHAIDDIRRAQRHAAIKSKMNAIKDMVIKKGKK